MTIIGMSMKNVSNRKDGQGKRVRNRDNGLGGMKMKISSFQGKSNTEEHFE